VFNVFKPYAFRVPRGEDQMGALVVNVLLGGIIFGYTVWQLGRFFAKRKKGACETCMLKDSCNGQSCAIGRLTIPKKFSSPE